MPERTMFPVCLSNSVWMEPRLGPLSAAYVLLTAMLGPFLARLAR
jgi:hypothetical protein